MNYRKLLYPVAFLLAALSGLNMSVTHAAAPVCQSSDADSDGDGWGWENFTSCRVASAATQSNSASPNNNSTGLSSSTSCAVSAQSVDDARALHGQYCALPVQDCDPFDGAWYCSSSNINGQKPAVVNSTGSASPQSAATLVSVPQPSINNPACQFTSADSDNDGWGWENNRSCVITNASQDTATTVQSGQLAPPPVAAATPGFSNGNPICLTDASDAGNNGYGYENNRTCVVVPGTTATRNAPLLNSRICTPWFEIGYGNYRLQNNTWNESDVHSDNWSQCIELTGSAGNYVARWDYNWLPRAQGNEYAVKSYPQVYYGRKTRYNVSGSVAETGLPANINRLPKFLIDFDYTETGVFERNVAFESFFHTSCEAENNNKQFELMVWVGVPSVRTPGTLLTTTTLNGREWDVYTNPTLGWAYVAFVAKQPYNKGTLNWNAFVHWSRVQGPAYGVPTMYNNACMGAIEIGTETFWGSGTFTLNKFNVRVQ